MNFTEERKSGLIFGDQETAVFAPCPGLCSSIAGCYRPGNTGIDSTRRRAGQLRRESWGPHHFTSGVSQHHWSDSGRGQQCRLGTTCVSLSPRRRLASLRAKTDSKCLPPTTVRRIDAVPRARSRWGQRSPGVGDWGLAQFRNQVQ